ncbi:MAG: hypothetical protein LUG45_05430 [Clostridiales bacterium]|nr:hypothetical protein [Clostridiales bacterium]
MSVQFSLDDMPLEEASDRSSSASSIGCCSRFSECSDLRRCTNPNPEISSICMYRRKLEAGQIFYGKNAAWYDEASYASLCRTMDSLPGVEEVLPVLCYFRRTLTRSVLLYRSKPLEAAVSAGLLEEISCASCIQRFRLSALTPVLSRDAAANTAYQAAKRSKPARQTEQQFLSSWLLQHRPDLAAELSTEFICVSLYGDLRSLVFLWMDNHAVASSGDIVLPETVDARFLKTAVKN